MDYNTTEQPPRSNLEYALEYARKGWRVLPLHTPDGVGRCSCHKTECDNVGKHPRTLNGLKDSTSDEERINYWWSTWKDANIGIATGADSGFVVLDVDPQHGGEKSLAVLEDKYGTLPKTLKVQTGGGGMHFYFTYPEGGVRNSVSKVGEGLDVRGDGGYIIAPPSLHASGSRYAVQTEAELVAMPDELLQIARERQQSSKGNIPVGERIPEGGRNNALFDFGCKLRRIGFGEPKIAALLIETNTLLCEPPLSEGEVKNIAASASRDAETFVPPPSSSQNNTRKSETKISFESAADLLARDFPEVKWAVDGLLSEGATILAGAPKAGKSFLALGLAIAIASGGRALGSVPVEQGDVLYLALEDGARRMQRRLLDMLKVREVPKRLTFAYNFPRLNEGGQEAIEDWLKTHPEARLIVVDTLKRVRPHERAISRIYNGDYDAVSPLNDMALMYGVNILIVHHDNKLTGNEDWFDSISGSRGLTGAVDAAMLLRRLRGQSEGTLYVAGRDIEDGQKKVKFDGVINGWSLIGDAPSSLADKVLGWLIEARKEGLSRSEIYRKNGGRSEGIADALAELKELGQAGFKQVPTNGKAQERWFALTSSPIDDDDDVDDDTFFDEDERVAYPINHQRAVDDGSYRQRRPTPRYD